MAPFYAHQVMKEMSTDGRERYVAWLVEHQGCRAQGESAEQAVATLFAVLPAYLRALDVGNEAPRTKTFAREVQPS